MRVYIAGPMRGVPEFGFPAFDDAAKHLRDAGHYVFSPAERDRAVGFDETGLTGHEDLEALGFDHAEAMRADLQWIVTEADAVALMPGWRDSTGARTEVATAQAIGLEVFELCSLDGDNFATRPVDTPVIPPSGERRVTSATGGSKGRKPLEVGAIDPLARAELGRVAAFGTAKYDRGNYLKGYAWSLCVDAMHRHILAFEAGEDRDLESGLLHTVHAAWHGLALASFVLREIGEDDRTVAP